MQNILIFDSRFENAIYKDISLNSEKKEHKIKFNILNLAKTSSLY